jgi:uncharacterized protein (DUF1800 family)
VPANRTAPQALDLVLDSIMKHPNLAPFVGKQLIQHLVRSNPSPAYVQRGVAAAFESGATPPAAAALRHRRAGDLAATVAAVLLDAEARAHRRQRRLPARADAAVHRRAARARTAAPTARR